eukprot:CFRG1900T1
MNLQLPFMARGRNGAKIAVRHPWTKSDSVHCTDGKKMFHSLRGDNCKSRHHSNPICFRDSTNPKYNQVKYCEESVPDVPSYNTIWNDDVEEVHTASAVTVGKSHRHAHSHQSTRVRKPKRSTSLTKERCKSGEQLPFTDHERTIRAVLRAHHSAIDSSKELDSKMCPFEVLREVIHTLRQCTERNYNTDLQRLAKLYLGWWNSAFYTDGHDVIEAIVTDLVNHPTVLTHRQKLQDGSYILNGSTTESHRHRMQHLKHVLKRATTRTTSTVLNASKIAMNGAVRECRRASSHSPGHHVNYERRSSVRFVTPRPLAVARGTLPHASRSSCPAIIQINELVRLLSVTSDDDSSCEIDNNGFTASTTSSDHDYFQWLLIDGHNL